VPIIQSGQRLTPAALNALAARPVYRTSDFASHISSTTLATDDVLALVVPAGTTWLVEFCLLVTGAGGNVKTQWLVPSGVSGTIRDCSGPDNTTGASDPGNLAASRHSGNTLTSDVIYATNSTTNFVRIRESAIVAVAGSSGTIAIRHAQASSNATATIIRARSWARFTQQ
jgi:hypothetical protein